MAITQTLTTSFKQELMEAIHDFQNGGDTFKIALYTSDATLDATTTAYSATNEVSGTGYVAGGASLTNVSPTTSGTVAYVDFNDVTWSTSTITNARGALIYNSSKANRAVAVLDFGGNKSTSASDFVIQFPAPNANNAIIRIS